MVGVLAFIGMLAGFYGFAFGANRLLLRKSTWDQYSLEAPWLTGPALAVLCVSLGGYRLPVYIPPWQAWLLLAAGWILTAAVIFWDRVELRALCRAHWRRGLTVLVPACCAAGMILWYFPGNKWDDVFCPWVIEYIVYGEQAAGLTGHQPGEPGTHFSEYQLAVRNIRNGQDLVTANVAQIAGRHPVQVIIPLAALCRFQHSIALGLLLCAFVQDPRKRWAVLALLLLDAFLLSETVMFASSFLSQNCAMPLYALYLTWLACQQQFRAREFAAILLMNLFFLVTYPEFLVISKAFEGLSLLIGLWRRNHWHVWPLAACNVALLAMHPLLLIARFHTLRTHMNQLAGWNVLGDPLEDPRLFFGNLVGLRYGCLGMDPWQRFPLLTWLVFAVIFGQMIVGLVWLARQRKLAMPLLALLAAVVSVHALGTIRGTNYYSGFKLLSHTYFVLIVGWAAWLHFDRRWLRRLTLAALGLWVVTAGYATCRMIPFIHHNGYLVSYSALRDAVAANARGQAVAAMCGFREPFVLLNMVSAETGVPLAALSMDQNQLMRDRHLGQLLDRTTIAPDGTLFRGLVLMDGKLAQQREIVWNDRALTVDCRQVLGRIGPLRLCEATVHCATASTFPENQWVHTGWTKAPSVYATSRFLALKGHISTYTPVPYRFTCHVADLNWSQEVIVDKAGPFEAVLMLPEAGLHRTIVVEFKDFATFRPPEHIANSTDSRSLGFILHDLHFRPDLHQ
jgi:hypothetical protein